ncbi:MAG: DUF4412 domain-containing protein [Desulfobacterales bacterium]|nr:MAG: DUF4412 domain-containing protein [Desulfobacterales bacterium]
MKVRFLHGGAGFLVIFMALAAVVQPAGAAEFSADTIIDRLGQKQQVKIYIKDRQIRAEMVDPFGQQQVLISRPGKDQTFMLYPKTKGYMAFPATAALSPLEQDPKAMQDNDRRRLLGQETVEGYVCDKYEIAFKNTYRGKLLVWVARKLDYPIQMVQVDGPPTGVLSRKLTNINEQRIEDSMFRVPAGYKKISKPVQGFCGAGFCTVSLY